MRSCVSFALSSVLVLAAGCQRVEVSYTSDSGGDAPGETTGETGDSGEEGGEGGDNLPTYNCDPGDDLACPDGQKCTPLLVGGKQNVYECVEDDNEHSRYDDCTPAPQTGQDGCEPGTVCLPDGFTSDNGLCLPLCRNDSDCDLALCVPDPFNQVAFCSDHCDPLAPFCGQQKLQCLHTEDRFTCKYGREDDDGGYGEDCDAITDHGCREGFVCLQGEVVLGCESGFCCTNVCDLTEDDTCESPATCNPLEQGAPPGFEHIGACYVPF
jgi:hypothetical protein